MPNITKRGFKKPLSTEEYDVNITNFNTDKIETEIDKLLVSDGGDVKDAIVTFTEAESDAELVSKSKLSVLVGLIKKKFNLFGQQMEHKADKIHTHTGYEPANANIQQHIVSAHAPSNAEQNVQSDWNVSDQNSDSFIKNKPIALPANGGNADTLDGLDSTAFARDVHGHNWLNMQMGNEVSLVKDFNSANGSLFVNYRDALVPIVTYIMCDGKTSGSFANMKAKDFYAGENLVWHEGNFPKYHASTNTSYGVGDSVNYGHCAVYNGLDHSQYYPGYVLSSNIGYTLNQTKAPKHYITTNTSPPVQANGTLICIIA